MTNKLIILVGDADRSQWLKGAIPSLEKIASIQIVAGDQTIDLQENLFYDLAIVDASTIKRRLGDVVEKLKENQPEAFRLVVTASPTWQRAREVFKAGADDYLKQMDAAKLVKICSELLNQNV